MSTKYPFPVSLEAVSEGINSLHDFLKHTYHDQKVKLSECVDIFKDGLTEAYNVTSSCVSSVMLPINNFIKDLTEMEEEFRQEHLKSESQYICLEGQMIPRSEVISLPMEENY
jgi:hypothetical protein